MFIGNINLKDLQKNFQMTDLIKLKDDIHLKDQKPIHHPFELEKKLDQALLEGDIDAIQDIAMEFNNYPSPDLCKGDPIRSRKNSMICTCTLITRLVMKAGIAESYAYDLSDLYINKIETIDDEEGLSYLNAVMLMDFMSQIKMAYISSNHPSGKHVKVAIDYINNHLHENLTLRHVAKELAINHSYLSRIFKEDMNLAFSEYVQQTRVKKAQHLLLLTDESLSEIAYSVGFTSQSHFSKVFKKTNNMTPKAYRSSHEDQLKKSPNP